MQKMRQPWQAFYVYWFLDKTSWYLAESSGVTVNMGGEVIDIFVSLVDNLADVVDTDVNLVDSWAQAVDTDVPLVDMS